MFRSLVSYRFSDLPSDLIAGLTLAAIAVPEQMATARLGGLPPQVGFYAFLAGALAFAVFGGSRFLSCGADSTIAPIFAGGLAVLAASGSPEYAVLAAGLALMVGILVAAAGVFRLGWIADLLSIPITVGFFLGIAAHILVSQLPAVLGTQAPDGRMIERFIAIVSHLDQTNAFTLALGLGVLVLIIGCELVSARIPGALIGLVLATLAVVLFDLERRGVPVIGNVSSPLPSPSLPFLSRDQWTGLVPLSLIVAAMVMVQTAATTRAFPSRHDAPPDVDRDFVGVGAGSIVAGLFGAFPVNASPPRTAVVAETGGRSQVGGIFAALLVLILLAFGASLLQHVPNAALGGVLLFVVMRLVRVGQIAAIYRQSFGEFLLIVATAAALMFVPIEQGVGLGIVLSLLHGLWTTTQARAVVFERVPGTSIWWPATPRHHGDQEPGVMVVGFPAPLSFLNAHRFRHDLLHMLHHAPEQPQLLMLEATGILSIDFTAAQVLGDVIQHCQTQGVTFAIARLESVRAQTALERYGIDKLLGPDRNFRSVEEAIRAFRAAHAGEAAKPT